MKNILLVGTGSLATLFACRLVQSGVQVCMLGSWKAAIEALNRDGAGLLGADGSTKHFPVRAMADPEVCQKADLVIALVKAWQTARAAQQLAKFLPAGVPVLSLQNGLGNREALAAELGPARVILGVTRMGASLSAPGVVRPGGEGLTSIEEHPCSGEISQLLEAAGLKTEIVADAGSLIWGKLVVSSAINPLTVLLNVPNGALLERMSACQLMVELAVETSKVAAALGVQLPFTNSAAEVETVVRRTAENVSSMLQDVRRGAPTEIDAICGEIARIGDELGIAVPLNRLMWQLVHALQDG